MKETEYGKVKVIYKDKSEVKEIGIDHLDLKDSIKNALKRDRIFTVGDILDDWDKLTKKSGIGITKAKEIRASVFALLCEFGCVKKLQYEG